MLRPCAALAAFLLAAAFAPRPLPAEPAPDLAVSIDAACKTLAARNKVAGAALGVHVVRVEDGSEVYGLAALAPLGVASNAKLVTTAAALHTLGHDFVWRTRVHLVGGERQGDAWTGHLLVIGAGDPNISGRFHADDPTAVFREWAAKLKAAGVAAIRGDLLLDDLLFDRTTVHPDWPVDQLQNWYCAPITALALNDDCVDVSVLPGDKAGAPAKIVLSPPTAHIQVVNQCVTVTSKRKHSFQILRDGAQITVRGGYILKGGGYTEAIAVQDPVSYFGAVLRETLAHEGIVVAGEVVVLDQPYAPAPAPESAVATLESRMPETLQVTNARSQNFYAEQLLKTMAAAQNGQGTFEGGAACMRAFLEAVGVPAEEFTVSDGCGLSAENRYSPAAITRVLAHAWKQPWAKTYIDSLAVSGESGTLQKRFREKDYAGRVKGKTGYIASVSTLSGYVETKHHGTWAFAILVNRFKTDLSRVRKFQDDLVKTWIDLPKGE